MSLLILNYNVKKGLKMLPNNDIIRQVVCFHSIQPTNARSIYPSHSSRPTKEGTTAHYSSAVCAGSSSFGTVLPFAFAVASAGALALAVSSGASSSSSASPSPSSSPDAAAPFSSPAPFFFPSLSPSAGAVLRFLVAGGPEIVRVRCG